MHYPILEKRDLSVCTLSNTGSNDVTVSHRQLPLVCQTAYLSQDVRREKQNKTKTKQKNYTHKTWDENNLLSVSLCFCLSVCLSACLSPPPFYPVYNQCLSVCQSICLSISLCVSVCLCLCLCLSPSLSPLPFYSVYHQIMNHDDADTKRSAFKIIEDGRKQRI